MRGVLFWLFKYHRLVLRLYVSIHAKLRKKENRTSTRKAAENGEG